MVAKLDTSLSIQTPETLLQNPVASSKLLYFLLSNTDGREVKGKLFVFISKHLLQMRCPQGRLGH